MLSLFCIRWQTERWVFEADFFFQYDQARKKTQDFVLARQGGESISLKSGETIVFDHTHMLHKKALAEEKGDSLGFRQLQQQCKKFDLGGNGTENDLRQRLHGCFEGRRTKLLNELRNHFMGGLLKMWKPKK